MTADQLILHCFNEHVKDLGEVYFTFAEYWNFWVSHEPGDIYKMTNKDRSVVLCRVAYYPLPYFKDLRALIEIHKGDYNDFREVPVKFLKVVL